MIAAFIFPQSTQNAVAETRTFWLRFPRSRVYNTMPTSSAAYIFFRGTVGMRQRRGDIEFSVNIMLRIEYVKHSEPSLPCSSSISGANGRLDCAMVCRELWSSIAFAIQTGVQKPNVPLS